MFQDTREIEKITFGVFSADEIKKMGVCKVDNPKLCNIDKGSAYGTVYDPRMGTVENGTNCDTCGNGVWDCPGHFGYIELNEPVIHPLYYKQVVSLIRCFCIKCFKLLMTEDQIKLNNLHRLKGIKRFAKILEKLEKIDMCSHCSHPQPDIKHTISDNVISMVYKDKEKGKISIVLQVNEIRKMFDNVSIDDVKLLGFDPDLVQPKNLILTMFPVIPTCFVENTFVLTNNGYKYIQDVDKNDMLYTHTGSFRKINDFQIKIHEGEIINIKTSYHANTIKCTSEHPFYVKEIQIQYNFEYVNGKQKRIKTKIIGNPEWVNAGKLSSNHFIGMKRNTNNIIPKFELEKNKNQFTKEKILKKLDDLNEWFFIGYFVGDGWVDFNHPGRFYISMNIRDQTLLFNLLNKINISFFIRKKTEQDKCVTFECHNFIFWNILKQFGHMAYNKKIPNWVIDSPNEYINEFLNGYCKADGYEHERNQIQIKTVSPNLAFSTQLLYMKIGKLAQVSICGKPKQSILKNGRIIKSNYNPYQISIVNERKKDLNLYLFEDEYVWFKITKKDSTLVKDIKVYNFEVDEDNSYCVENLISHNCCRPYVISESNVCDDDLTIQLVEIIKANNHLEQQDGIQLSDTKKQKHLQSLKFRISTFYNNSCLAPETPILMWDGSIKRADQVEWGDELIGDDGDKRTVQVVCSGEDEMYEISQKNGETYTVNSNHYLTLKYPEQKEISWVKPDRHNPNGYWMMTLIDNETFEINDILYPVYSNKDETFKEISDIKKKIKDVVSDVFDIKVKDYLKLNPSVINRLRGIKLDKSISWEGKKVLTDDPYLFGVELFNIINDNKYIPGDILYNDENVRLQLLAGIIDSIGTFIGYEIYINRSGIKHEMRMNQIDFLVKTLGMNSSMKKHYDNLHVFQIEIIISGKDIVKIPSKMKINECKNASLLYSTFDCDDHYSTIKVNPIGKGKYNGFIIDKNHRFLLGDFTVTHNSGKAKHSTNGRAIKGIKERLTGKEGLIRTNLMGKRLLITGECL